MNLDQVGKSLKCKGFIKNGLSGFGSAREKTDLQAKRKKEREGFRGWQRNLQTKYHR